MSDNQDLPKALDLSHHLTIRAKNRQASFLKELYKYAAIPGMTRMAEGAPSFLYLPYEQLAGEFAPSDALPLDPPRHPVDEDGRGPAVSDVSAFKGFSVSRHAKVSSEPSLTEGLQYQDAAGPERFYPFLREYVKRSMPPAYADWDLLLNVGATDGCFKVGDILMEPNDAILVEEWTYPGSTASYVPLAVEMIGVKMDGDGIIPAHLEKLLSEWNPTEHQGRKRPHVLYTIPTGQNPTGATMSRERKQTVYDLCVKYDVVIFEDDPYYPMYYGPWTPRNDPHRGEPKELLEDSKEGNEAFLRFLPKSFLEFDTEGRVIRVDTFSKTTCPGARLGWFVASKAFIERLTRTAEGTSSSPSGFSTIITGEILSDWGVDGYIRWVRGIRAGYKMRRDWLCDHFEDVFSIERYNGKDIIEGGLNLPNTITCFDKDDSGTTIGPALVSFIPPSGGMFIFMCIHFGIHPAFNSLAQNLGAAEATAFLQEKAWRKLAANMVLFAPALPFDAGGEHTLGGEANAYFRMSFAPPTYKGQKFAVVTLRTTIRDIFELSLCELEQIV